MRRHAARTLTALLAFALGCASSATGDLFRAPRPAPKAKTAKPPPRIPDFPAPPTSPSPTPTPAPTPAAEPGITQELVVTFPRAGRVHVRAVEKPGETMRVEFDDDASAKPLASFPVTWPGDEVYFMPSAGGVGRPFLRLDVLRPDELASPLVIAAAVSPGGSGGGFCVVVVGEVGGRLKLLTPEPLTTSNIGGVFVGDLGRGRGFGAAAWDFIWDFDDGESHYAPHRYEVQQYAFDRRRGRFRRGPKLRSRGKYACHGEGALEELGLAYTNLLEDIPDVSAFNQP